MEGKERVDILTSTEPMSLEHAMYYGQICFWSVQASGIRRHGCWYTGTWALYLRISVLRCRLCDSRHSFVSHMQNFITAL